MAGAQGWRDELLGRGYSWPLDKHKVPVDCENRFWSPPNLRLHRVNVSQQDGSGKEERCQHLEERGGGRLLRLQIWRGLSASQQMFYERECCDKLRSPGYSTLLTFYAPAYVIMAPCCLVCKM
ncbi:unnamed protein product [Boreogadus saida]